MPAVNYLWTGASSSAWATAGNWTPAGPPAAANSDTALFDATGGVVSVVASDQSATLLARLQITSTYTGAFGDAAAPLQVGATSVLIGEPSRSSQSGQGSGRINLKLGTNQTTVQILSTKNSSTDSGKEPVRIQGVHASNKAIIQSGRVGFATDNITDVSTFSEISLIGTGAYANIASGVTLTTLRMAIGTALLNCALTTAQIDGGTLTTQGSGAITTANISGTAYLNSTGTITTLNVNADGSVSMLSGFLPRTITTVKLYKGATFSYDPAIVTITNPIQLIGCGYEDVTINTPAGITVAIVKT